MVFTDDDTRKPARPDGHSGGRDDEGGNLLEGAAEEVTEESEDEDEGLVTGLEDAEEGKWE